MSTAASCTRVYALHGKTAHLVLPGTAVSGIPRALCRIRPYLSRPWFGTGDQGEYDKAASLPLCGKCEIAARTAEGTR